ncbi:MAG: M23 family metallopeptidase [Spirochaetes bacterium]|nr:M23 family metallopeptidase [Spirochaetota bacterium]MBU1080348.1 M23 family metallopeptidase [Spirochaetota bacterium]
MEMQNVIGEQYIAPRRKPTRIMLDKGLVRPASNGRISRTRVPRDLFAEGGPRGRRSGIPLEPGPAAAKARTGRSTTWRSLSAAAVDRLSILLESMAAPRLMTAIAVFIGIALFVVAISAVGAIEKKADLAGFFLHDDGTMTGLLLDAVSAEAVADVDPESAMPGLPTQLSLSSYKVARNDTLDAISKRFGLRLDTLISVNGIGDVRRISAGTTLKIPNIDGVAYTVRKGDSLSSISAARGVSILDIIDSNDISSQTIQPGQTLFIPGARLSSYDLKKALGKLVIWPISGRISSNFGYRPNPFTGIRQFHNGLDIVGPLNMQVRAAIDGRVAETGYSAVFGNFIILTHPEGYQTLYAHLSSIGAKQGASVAQGSTIGLVGTTGYSTGPHLHFGVFKNGIAIDPMKLLKGR